MIKTKLVSSDRREIFEAKLDKTIEEFNQCSIQYRPQSSAHGELIYTALVVGEVKDKKGEHPHAANTGQ